MNKLELHWQILIAIVIAGLAGWAVNAAIARGVADPSFLGISLIALFDYIGSLFLNALKMIIVPLVFSSIVIGVAGIGSGGDLGALGGRTLLFYAVTTLAATCIGLLLINVVGPGYVDGKPAAGILALSASSGRSRKSPSSAEPVTWPRSSTRWYRRTSSRRPRTARCWGSSSSRSCSAIS